MKKLLTMALALMMILSLFAVPTMAADDGVVFLENFEDYDNNGGTKTASTLWNRFTSFVTGYGDTGYALNMKMETSHQTNGLAQRWKSGITLAAGDYTFSVKIKAYSSMASNPFEGLAVTPTLFTNNQSIKVTGEATLLTKEWQTISLDFTIPNDVTTAANPIELFCKGGPASGSVNVVIDDVTIVEKAAAPEPTEYAVTINTDANAITSVAAATSEGEAVNFTAKPKFGYYIASITIGGEAFTGFDAYKGGTYSTGAIEADTAIVVTVAELSANTEDGVSTAVATLPVVFAEAGEAPVTFGKVLADVTTVDEFGIYLTKGGEGVTSAKTEMGPHFKAFYNVNGQYAIEFQGLEAGEYVAQTYVKVAGEITYGIATTFTVE